MAENNADYSEVNGNARKPDDVHLQHVAGDQYGSYSPTGTGGGGSGNGDKTQLIDETSDSHAVKKEYSPLQMQDAPSGKDVRKSEGLKVIIASSVIFAVSITIALIITIYFGPPQVPLHGSVACDSAICSKIGTDILKKGGHAVDAAVAATFCQGVVHMHASGPGGGGFMIVHDHRHNRSQAFNFRSMAPASAVPNQFPADPTKAVRGQAVAVPGEVKALEQAHKMFGKLPWKDLIQPSIDLARNGFNVSKDLAKHIEKTYAEHKTELDGTPLGDFLSPGGIRLQEGDRITRLEYAKLLEAIATDGSAVLYEKEYAQEIIETVNSAGVLMTLADFLNYTVIENKPLHIIYNTFSVMAPPAPSGGPVMLSVLNTLNFYNFSFNNQNQSLTYHRIVEALKFGFADRLNLGDPNFSPMVLNFTDEILRPEYGNKTVERIDDSKTYLDPSHYGAMSSAKEMSDTGTGQVSVIGANEDMVSITSSINYPFGSLLMTPSGIILNNDMTDFSSSSQQHQENVVEPRKRPLSSMTPAIVHSQKRPCGWRITLGASGGTQILSALVQVLVDMLSFHAGPDEAVVNPRVHNQLVPSTTYYEDDLAPTVVNSLTEKGHKMQQTDMLAAVNVAAKINETLYGYSDKRRDSHASVF